MRGNFAMVLAVGVAAGAALLMWDDGTGEERGGFVEPGPRDAGPDGTVPGRGNEREVRVPNPGTSDDDRPRETAPPGAAAVISKVRTHLRSKRPDLAAAEILKADAGVLADSVLRREVFRTATALRAAAPRATGDVGTRRLLQARKLYSALYDCEASTTSELEAAFTASGDLHRSLVTSAAAPDALVMRHKFKSGENLWTLRHGPWKTAGISVASGFVLRVNGLTDARRIRAGQTLRIPRESLSLLVRKDRFEATLLLGGSPVARFPVGLGTNDCTPEGHFKIETKLRKPTWSFNGRLIPYGDPDNVIGTRWMGFSDTESAQGIGIHGTSDESSVGTAASLGCIRMKQVDVERLFEWVPRGCEVEIR